MHWFYDANFRIDSRQIAASELTHLKSLRIRPGEEIAITDGAGSAFSCEVQDPVGGYVSNVKSIPTAPRSIEIHLIQALAKGDRDEQALQASVELGVSSVTPWRAEHSVVIWGEKAQRNQARWQEIAVAAMKQSQQAYLPTVNHLHETRELRPTGTGILLDPSAEKSIAEISNDVGVLTLVVGPEGGISPTEKALLIQNGFTPYRLGRSVLRTSTAGPAAIAGLMASRGIW